MTFSGVKRVLLRTLPDNLLLRLKKIHYRSVLLRSTGSEEPELAVLPQIIFPGACALDIGANFGLYTYHLARLVGPSGKVISMEPITSTFEILTSNIARLRMGNVSCINKAASDVCGSVEMEVPQYDSGGRNFYEARIIPGRHGRIPCITLDSSCLGLQRLDFIKCDVEGHELSVLRGATQVIAKFRPTWLIESSGHPDDSKSRAWQVFEFLKQFGYRGFLPAAGTLRLRAEGEKAINYFFVSLDKAERFTSHSTGEGARRPL